MTLYVAEFGLPDGAYENVRTLYRAMPPWPDQQIPALQVAMDDGWTFRRLHELSGWDFGPGELGDDARCDYLRLEAPDNDNPNNPKWRPGCRNAAVAHWANLGDDGYPVSSADHMIISACEWHVFFMTDTVRAFRETGVGIQEIYG